MANQQDVKPIQLPPPFPAALLGTLFIGPMTGYGTYKFLEQAGLVPSAVATALTVLAGMLASYHGIASVRKIEFRRYALLQLVTAGAIYLVLLIIGP